MKRRHFHSAVGNRQQVTDNGQITGYTANHLNQYTVVDGSTLSYDANGNLSNTVAGVLGDWSYTYDAQNRLIRVVGGPSSVVAEFYYDARNRCVKRVINGVTTYLIYDNWSLLEERNLAGNLLARYYHGPVIDELLCRVTATNTVYYHHDGLGSTVALTDAPGNVVESYTYDVYGQPSFLSTTYHLLPTSAVTNRFFFTGREYLADLALYDYRHRFYSPSLGRFMQTDPMRLDAKDINFYRYVSNCPTIAIDPLGLIVLESEPDVTWSPPACRNGETERFIQVVTDAWNHKVPFVDAGRFAAAGFPSRTPFYKIKKGDAFQDSPSLAWGGIFRSLPAVHLRRSYNVHYV